MRLTFNFVRRAGCAPGGEDYRWDTISSLDRGGRPPSWCRRATHRPPRLPSCPAGQHGPIGPARMQYPHHPCRLRREPAKCPEREPWRRQRTTLCRSRPHRRHENPWGSVQVRRPKPGGREPHWPARAPHKGAHRHGTRRRAQATVAPHHRWEGSIRAGKPIACLPTNSRARAAHSRSDLRTRRPRWQRERRYRDALLTSGKRNSPRPVPTSSACCLLERLRREIGVIPGGVGRARRETDVWRDTGTARPTSKSVVAKGAMCVHC